MSGTYFDWLTAHTKSNWTNDSALEHQLNEALAQGAAGGTCNPPLAYEALTVDSKYYADDLAAIDRRLSDDEFAFEAMGLVIRRIANKLLPMHREKQGYYGCIRAQVAPNLRYDAERMLKYGKRIAAWGDNVMVKIPGTKAGIRVLEELAALGIPTNPTVMVSVSQMIAAAEAFERGCERAKAAGIKPSFCTSALVIGRLQDYLVTLNAQRGNPVSQSDIEWACLAAAKRTGKIFEERKFNTTVMAAAFRCAMQVEQISGAPFCSTIHPSIQALVHEADAAGNIRREELYHAPVDEAIIERVSQALPEFALAYAPNGLAIDEFGSFGAVIMTLDGFHQGWLKLISLK